MDKITYEQAIELSLKLSVDGYCETMRVYNHAVEIANAELDEKLSGWEQDVKNNGLVPPK